MKNFLKYLIIILLFISCSSTKNVQKLESVKFELPKGAVKIENATLDQNNKKDQKLMLLKNIYKINDVYIGMNDPYKGEVKNDLLKDIKDGSDYDYKKFGFIESHQYKSSLENINNYETLIIYTYYEDVGQYSFRKVNKEKTQIFGGTIVFEKQSDYTEATKIVNDLLNSVKFD
ncbi:hypothetical protein C8C83_0573 [Flavobacterium sp. 90]|uniref:hypothetical protein n=1 Tax=unclassified Flavobacterium TaxID=196869 RepID=UPI000EB3458C|nr:MULTISPECIES: hypothetical protein [unclassified Flavobacterium]RKR08975.1 hypothetical protein C8C82_0868 [Flavobacterium sp. 81]TCK52763.1 hypothetical protein C8C83_0573 [Flavobacterium sp. 90]